MLLQAASLQPHDHELDTSHASRSLHQAKTLPTQPCKWDYIGHICLKLLRSVET